MHEYISNISHHAKSQNINGSSKKVYYLALMFSPVPHLVVLNTSFDLLGPPTPRVIKGGVKGDSMKMKK